MLRNLGLVVCCSAALLGGVVQAESRDVVLEQEASRFAQSNRVAVVVGVNAYDPQSGLRPLKFAVPDAQLVKQGLERHNYSVQLLADHRANRDYILDAIEQAGRVLDPEQGTLVFFFSGHGFGDPATDTNYLATYNTLSNRLAGSALSLREVEAAIRKTGARRAMMFIDACRDNPFLGKSTAQPNFLEQNAEGIKTLYATKFGELSYETPQLRHGVFSHFLFQGLAGQAVEQDGIVSFDSLTAYVQEETAQWTFKALGKTQKPYSRDNTDSFGVLVVGRLGGDVPPPPRPDPTPQPQPDPSPVPASYIEPKMVSIPAGTFMMGCVEGRDNVEVLRCIDDEKPAHTVSLNAFQIGKYEVTFAEYDLCTAAGICPEAQDRGWGRGNRPVINVSWHNAQTYLRWLGDKTGKQYRLPTEAEWEYAARAGADTVFPWGNSISCANADFESNGSCYGEGTSPVGRFAANRWGLHDMVGNVGEWVGDCWWSDYQGAPVDGSAREGCGADESRVLRGGSWGNPHWVLSSASRGLHTPDNPYYDIGFRAARTN